MLPVTVAWENPPEHEHPRATDWGLILAPLRTRPGVWGRVMDYGGRQSAASALWQARCRLPDLFAEFETRSARIDSGSAIYARYIGKSAA